jgi:hypothetical protein
LELWKYSGRKKGSYSSKQIEYVALVGFVDVGKINPFDKGH